MFGPRDSTEETAEVTSEDVGDIGGGYRVAPKGGGFGSGDVERWAVSVDLTER